MATISFHNYIEMATPSPQPPQTNGKTTPKLFETIGTFGRKKKIREAEAAQGIVQEGKQAIDGNEQHPVFDTSPESFPMVKNDQ
ncbi:hypothetical protein DERF_008334 [Dermatophagoides farinae]|uniref:Uncharacterized protein n=1 Tax=Dermatophagoides farinae TaxID=6954 RepID=A0A922L5D6_DERFA|nr:hypothetical protein DERF_008334 [Dermatophagoides farinae]